VPRTRSPNNLTAYLLVIASVWISQVHLLAANPRPPAPPNSDRAEEAAKARKERAEEAAKVKKDRRDAAVKAKKDRAEEEAKARFEPEYSVVVEGAGETREDAWQDALEKAQAKVTAYVGRSDSMQITQKQNQQNQ